MISYVWRSFEKEGTGCSPFLPLGASLVVEHVLTGGAIQEDGEHPRHRPIDVFGAVFEGQGIVLDGHLLELDRDLASVQRSERLKGRFLRIRRSEETYLVVLAACLS
jgi:hypothetical protein